jgi:hypothetical protein
VRAAVQSIDSSPPASHTMDPNAAFDLFDADKDGRITREELLKAMETIGMRPTDEQLRRLIDGADSSGNGFVSRQDFVNLISRSQPVVSGYCLFAPVAVVAHTRRINGWPVWSGECQCGITACARACS